MIQTKNIPWKAWFGDEKFGLTFPDNWQVTTCAMKDAKALTENEIKTSF